MTPTDNANPLPDGPTDADKIYEDNHYRFTQCRCEANAEHGEPVQVPPADNRRLVAIDCGKGTDKPDTATE